MSAILYAILFWLLYTFITRFIIPVYKTSRQIKTQFDEMKERFGTEPTETSASKPEKMDKGDYIDFEEVKE